MDLNPSTNDWTLSRFPATSLSSLEEASAWAMAIALLSYSRCRAEEKRPRMKTMLLTARRNRTAVTTAVIFQPMGTRIVRSGMRPPFDGGGREAAKRGKRGLDATSNPGGGQDGAGARTGPAPRPHRS